MNTTAKALIVIDVQNDYFKKGTMPLFGMDEALEQTNKLISYAREKGHQIYFIQHIALKKEATFFRPNTTGVQLHAQLDIQNDRIIEKNYPNSFRETSLHHELQNNGIKELIICGAMTHMCIDTSVRAGFDLGYNITLSQDACATKDLTFNGRVIGAKEVHESFMSALHGTFCMVEETQTIIKM